MNFIDLHAQQAQIRQQLEEAMINVLNHGKYIMGPEVQILEEQLASFAKAKHCISCSSGTDALYLVLLAQEVTKNDAVFVPSFTFAASAEVIALAGATPVFVDVQADTFNMDPENLVAAIEDCKKNGLNPKMVISVDLYGQAVNYDAIQQICKDYHCFHMADAAQSFGATYKGQPVGSLADCTTTSFFPAKPLGCYGDGGAIFTDDAELAAIIKSLRVHGQGNDRYENVRIGINGRLDSLQAAILIEKLKIFPDELKQRQRAADYYNQRLNNVVATPFVSEGTTSAWAQYTIKVEQRDQVSARLKEQSIPTMVYYPNPMHLQQPYKDFPQSPLGLKQTEKLAHEVLSLPMHPYLSSVNQDKIIHALKDTLNTINQ